MWIWWWNRVKLWMVLQWMMKMEIWHCNQMSQFLYIYIATLQWNKTVFMWCFVWQTMQKIYTYGIYMTNFRGSCCESAKVKSQHSISIHIIIIIIVNVVVVIVWCIDTRTNRFCGFSYSFKQKPAKIKNWQGRLWARRNITLKAKVNTQSIVWRIQQKWHTTAINDSRKIMCMRT